MGDSSNTLCLKSVFPLCSAFLVLSAVLRAGTGSQEQILQAEHNTLWGGKPLSRASGPVTSHQWEVIRWMGKGEGQNTINRKPSKVKIEINPFPSSRKERINGANNEPKIEDKRKLLTDLAK